MVPLAAWLAARWWVVQSRRDLNKLTDARARRFASATGVDVATQRQRMQELNRTGILVREAYTLGLLRDGWGERWPEFVLEREVGWNLAASGRGAEIRMKTLADKAATNAVLRAAGVPVVPNVLVTTGSGGSVPTADEVSALANDWLAMWPQVFGKPRVGSAGEESFELARTPDGRLQVGHFQSGEFDEEPLAALARLLSKGDYLIQPKLTSHPELAEVASERRVVTLRVVTRDLGDGPKVFSCALEVALPLVSGTASMVQLVVGAEGVIEREAFPEWLKASEESQPSPVTPDESANGQLDELMDEVLAHQQRVVTALCGQVLPHYDKAVAMSVAAHRQFPGLFAVAWDIAITEAAPIMLEGNTGFASMVPQWISGGLLEGYRGRLPAVRS